MHNSYLTDRRCIRPRKPKTSARDFSDWVDGFDDVPRQASTPAFAYQERVLGGFNERRIRLAPPYDDFINERETLDIDGFDADRGALLDAKFVTKPKNSPYTGGESVTRFEVTRN